MNGRERILAVLDRKPVDRIPFEMGGTDCSSIHVIPYKKLKEHFGLGSGPVKCGCLIQLIAEFDEEMRDRLQVDAEPLAFESTETKVWKAPFGVDLVVPAKWDVEDLADGGSTAKNPQGTVYSKRAADAYYFDPVGVPLADVRSSSDLDAYDMLFDRWDYSYIYDEPVEDLAQRAKKQYNSTDRAVVALWRMHYLQAGQIMRGYEQFLIDMMLDKDLTHAILSKLHEVYLKRTDTFLEAFGDYLDIVFLTDDLGTQNSGLVSPDVYKEMIFPYAAELIARIKDAGKKVVMHTCGAVSDFIPFLIEMGVDAVNPVQVSAAGMNPSNLVREFGKDIAFWGGGCDTQHALNQPDTGAVKKDVQLRLNEFGENASLVFTQVHNIQYDVPVQNIVALREAFIEYSG